MESDSGLGTTSGEDGILMQADQDQFSSDSGIDTTGHQRRQINNNNHNVNQPDDDEDSEQDPDDGIIWNERNGDIDGNGVMGNDNGNLENGENRGPEENDHQNEHIDMLVEGQHQHANRPTPGNDAVTDGSQDNQVYNPHQIQINGNPGSVIDCDSIQPASTSHSNSVWDSESINSERNSMITEMGRTPYDKVTGQILKAVKEWGIGEFSLFKVAEYHPPEHLIITTGYVLDVDLHKEASANWKAACMLIKQKNDSNLLERIENTIESYPRSIHAYANKAVYHLLRTPSPNAESACREAIQQLKHCLTDSEEITNATVQYAFCSYHWGSFQFYDANQEFTEKAVSILEENVPPQGATNPSHHVMCIKVLHSEARNKLKYMKKKEDPEYQNARRRLQSILSKLMTQMIAVVATSMSAGTEAFRVQAEIQILDLLADLQVAGYLRNALAQKQSLQNIKQLHKALRYDEERPYYEVDFYLSKLISATKNLPINLPCASSVSNRIAHHFVVASHNKMKMADLETRRSLLSRAEKFLVINQENHSTAADVYLELWALEYYEQNKDLAEATFDDFYGPKPYRDVTRHLKSYFYKQLPSDGPQSAGRHHLERVRDYMEGLSRCRRIRFLLGEDPKIIEEEMYTNIKRFANEDMARRHSKVVLLEHYGVFLEALGRRPEALEKYKEALLVQEQIDDNYTPNVAIHRSKAFKR